jgi:hypothetical protein
MPLTVRGRSDGCISPELKCTTFDILDTTATKQRGRSGWVGGRCVSGTSKVKTNYIRRVEARAQTDGRQEGKKEGMVLAPAWPETKVAINGRKEGRTEWTEGKTDGRKKERKEGKNGVATSVARGESSNQRTEGRTDGMEERMERMVLIPA